MHITRIIFRCFLGLLALSLHTAQAATKCDPFPEVSWWGNLTHDKVIRYVEKKHDGDWAPYIKKWEAQVETMQGVYKRKSAVIIKAKGIRLEGDVLLVYMAKVKMRVAINHCLADEGPSR